MSKIKALITMVVLGSSSAAMASPGVTFTAHANATFGSYQPVQAPIVYRQPAPVPLPAPAPMVRDHRFAANDRYFRDSDRQYRYDQDHRDRYVQISGAYSSKYGDVILHQRGNRVWGTYPGFRGTIEGVIEGNVVDFHWIQPDSNGYGTFTLTRSGRIRGLIGSGVSYTNGGSWDLWMR